MQSSRFLKKAVHLNLNDFLNQFHLRLVYCCIGITTGTQRLPHERYLPIYFSIPTQGQLIDDGSSLNWPSASYLKDAGFWWEEAPVHPDRSWHKLNIHAEPCTTRARRLQKVN